MKILFSKPFWVYNPRVASMLDEIEIELRKGNEVSLMCCNGELINGCVDNPLMSKITCNACIYFRNRDLNLLSKKVNIFNINEFIDNEKPYKNLSWNYENAQEIKDILYKDVDIGYAALSAYIQLTRNQSPKITSEFKLFFDQYLNNGAIVTDAINKAIDKLNPDVVGVFNARIHTRRPVLRVCQQRNIECNVYEHTGLLGSKVCKKTQFNNCLPHDLKFNTKLIYSTWENSPFNKKEKTEFGSDYYIKRRTGQKTEDISFTKNQDANLKPEDWNDNKRNIVIFNSSDDEFTSLGKDWEYNIGESRIGTLQELFNHFLGDNTYHFYLRIHPNLSKIKYKYLTDLYSLNEYSNVTIIPPDSNISSYLLLDLAEKIITFGSTMGIEAVYWGKPSILLGKSLYKGLNINYCPKDHQELFHLIETSLTPKEKDLTIYFGFFRMHQGTDFMHFNPNYYKKIEFRFRGKLLLSFNKNYREKMYKGLFSSTRNFIKYKQHSIPKNIWKKLHKNFIPIIDE
jgi:hypothetical protein